MNLFQVHSLGFYRQRIYSCLSLDKSSINTNNKLRVELYVKPSRLIHIHIIWRGFLIEFSLRYVCLFVSLFCGIFHSISLILNLDLDQYWCSGSRMIVGSFVLVKFSPTSHIILHTVNYRLICVARTLKLIIERKIFL
jgi:hypothetical protein